jgi:hypothetical protein
MPQVTMSATDAKAMDNRVVLNSGGEKISRSGREGPARTDSCQRSDSGTARRMRKVSTAGEAPTNITQRHESRVMWN